MMEIKKRDVIIAIVLLLAIVGVVWWLLRDAGVDNDIEQGSEQVQVEEVVQSIEPSMVSEPADAVTIGRTFVERFGSFSNQSAYENITSVLGICTKSLQERLVVLREDALDDEDAVYYGVSTHVLSIEQLEVTEDTEVLSVLTQREEAIEHPAYSTIKYQTIELTLQKQGDEWFVHDFQWKD